MKKLIYTTILAIACVGAFGFKSEHKRLIVYWVNNFGTATAVYFQEDPCPGFGEFCYVLINGNIYLLYEDPQLTIPAERYWF